MKKLFALLALMVFLVPSLALAADFKTTDVVSKDESPNNLYIASQTVTVDANTTGDLTAAGNTVTVNGSVQNSANLAAATVILKGNVGQNARVAGGNVTIDGTVGEDLVVFAGTVTLGSTSIVKGDLIIYGGTVNLNGQVLGKVVGSGGDIVINGSITGGVELKNIKTLALTDIAHIGGDLTYSAVQTADVSSKAVVVGKTHYTKIEGQKKSKFAAAGLNVFGLIAGMIGGFILLMVVTLVAPKASKQIVENSFKNIWANVGIGFAVLVAAPVAMLIVLVTFIGAPLAGLAFLLYLLAVVLGGIYGTLVLGSLIKKYVLKSATYEIGWQAILIGVVLMAIIKVIPFVGWIVAFAFFLIALGTVVKQTAGLLKVQK